MEKPSAESVQAGHDERMKRAAQRRAARSKRLSEESEKAAKAAHVKNPKTA